MTRFAAFFGLILGVLAPTLGAAQPVTVFAAASLRGVLEDIVETYQGEARLSFGGSGTIARQVAAGAPADVVILANKLWSDWLFDRGVTGTKPPILIAVNKLVVVATAPSGTLSNITELPAALGSGRLAMGQRDGVPAGRYARQWLEAAGLWDQLEDRLAETDNVRAALALVARGDVPIGIVYATDALAETAVDVIWAIPTDQHDPIQYPAAALTPSGEDFLAHLTSLKALQVFAAHGFEPVPE